MNTPLLFYGKVATLLSAVLETVLSLGVTFSFLFFFPRAFVEENEGVYDQQVYNVLEVVAVLHPSTVTALIPFLSLSLRKTECKRGLGKNTSLRYGISNLHVS